ncbi:MAG TPA: hypothetical protein DEG43_04070, partial [Acidimicrobiaceae bacterium]|nr:hypothetical protein [Acidimicrobiaceae bacterium]
LSHTGSKPMTQLQFRDQTFRCPAVCKRPKMNGAPCGAGCALGAGILTTTLAAPIPAGGSATITYTAAPTTTGRLYNLATVPTYNDPFGTPYVDGLSASVTHLLPDPQLTLSKEVASSLRSLSGGVVASTSGTAVPFTFTIRNTSTTTAYAPTVTETPPTGFCIVAASATNGVTSPAANTWQLPGNLAPGAVFTFDANLVVCGDPTIGSQTNLATLTWNDAADGLSSNGTPYSTADTADFAVAAPTFKITKSPAIDAGATIQQDADPLDAAPSDGEWVIVVENTSDVSVGGVVVNDPMPATFEYRTGDATATWLTGTPHTISDTTNSAFPGGVLAGRRTGARIVINQLDPHQRVRISIPFVQNGAVPATGETTMVNTATLTNANWQAGEEITAQGEYTILPNETSVRVAKSVSTGGAGGSVPGVETVQATPSDQVKFTLDVTIEGDGLNVATHDIVVRDLLPDGMSLTNVPATGAVPSASGWTATCISGPCVAQYNGVFLGSRGAGSRTEVLWYLGDYTNTANSVYRITFTARVDATFANGMEVVDGFNDPLVNSARAWWNRAASRGGGANGNVYPLIPATMPIQSDLDMAGRRDNAAIDITTPHVELQKKV